jgi:hypothetical protein
MFVSPLRVRVVVVFLAVGVVGLPGLGAGCASSGASGAAGPPGSAAPTTTVTTVEVAPPELDAARLCRVLADVDDAAARGALGALRLRFETAPAGDRHADFGAMLARQRNEERFSAFRDDEREHPQSPVGPLGECLIYSDWHMETQRTTPCGLAAERLGTGGASVLRYADALHRWRSGDPRTAIAEVQTALSVSPTCESLHFLRARLVVAVGGDAGAQKQAWADAEAAMPGCFTCAIETGKLVEAAEGKVAAAAAWERALKAVPDHAETLRRLAAAVAGVDDARALAAYASAVDAGARDFVTLLAAAKLAAQLAQSPADVDRALGFARRAVDVGKSDPEARRLLVALAMKKGDDATAEPAARALLDLVADDVVGHAALARVALRAERLIDAVSHYEGAAAEIAAGRTGGLDSATVAAITSERQALLGRLRVDDGARTSGNAGVVANAAQRALTKLWKERKAAAPDTPAKGELTVVVETDATGRIVDVQVKASTVDDPAVVAAAVAALRRMTITGGAKRYTFDFALE